MAIFELELPDKRVITLEAPDQASAVNAAQMWQQSNAAQPVDTVSDVVKSAGTGLARGAIGLAGMTGDFRDLGLSAASAAASRLGASPEGIAAVRPVADKLLRALPLMSGPTSQQITRGIESYTGEFRKPQTTAGKYAQTAGEFAFGALMPGGLVRRAANVIAPALGSEAAGQATEGTDWEPYARVGGALAGGLAPGVVGRAITPAATAPGRRAAVDVLEREGVTSLAPGQVTGSKRLQYFESENGGARAQELTEQAAEQFTAAALRRTGETANRARPEVVDRAFTRVGGQFDDLAGRNTVAVDTKTWDSLQKARDDYFIVTPPAARAPIIEKLVSDIGEAAANNRGTLPGNVYKELRTRITTMERNTTDKTLKDALGDMRNAVDDAMQRTPWVSQADKDAWQTARRQYRNLLVIERAATAGGENAASGLLSPAQLRMGVVNQNKRDYARGRGDFAELVRAGNEVMTPLPNSGTAPRLKAQGLGLSMPTAIGSVLGGGVGASLGNPTLAGVGAGAGAVIGAIAPAVLGRMALSGPGRAYLTNNAAAGFQNAPPWLHSALLQSALSRPVDR